MSDGRGGEGRGGEDRGRGWREGGGERMMWPGRREEGGKGAE